MTNIMMLVTALALLAGVPICIEAGRLIGRRRGDRDGKPDGRAPLAGTVFALLGLLVAFTFSGAAARLDQRRALIVQEANAIGTAWLRLDLLPADAQPALRDQFRRYLDLRLAVYDQLPDLEAARAELTRADAMQREIWNAAVRAVQAAPSPAVTTLVMPALNEMIDLTTTRTVFAQTHPPTVIFALLYLLLLVSALLLGFDQAAHPRPLVHSTAFTAIMAVSVFVILNLEYPRLGFIGLEATDQVLVDLRRTME
jgi:hypothetical protein